VQERLKSLGELDSLTYFFFQKPASESIKELIDKPPDKQLQKLTAGQLRPLLAAAIDKLESSDFSLDDIREKLNRLLEELETKPSVLFPLIRIGVSGSAVSPEIFGTLVVLGKQESLERLQSALALVDA
jgi:glutamyl-tRNA synthetase